MKKIAPIFVASLVLFEIFAFFLVSTSNRALSKTLALAGQTQTLVLPNAHVAPSLEKILPAFWASLLITLTGGVALSFILCLGIVFIFPSLAFQSRHSRLFFQVYGTGIVLSGLIVFALADTSLFHRARDYVLLSSRPGIQLNNFYYQYAPYAVQAITPPRGHPVSPCWLDGLIPGKNDRFYLIRSLCQVGLLGALPLVCSLIIFSGIHRLFRCKASPTTAVFLSGVSLVVLVLAGLWYLYPQNDPTDLTTLNARLASPSSRTRIQALRTLYQKRIPPDQIPEYLHQPLKTKHIAEKYWLAMVLSRPGASGNNLDYLYQLLNDSSLNVRCAAIKSLSALGCSPASKAWFQEITENSLHWYEQQTALAALRKCR